MRRGDDAKSGTNTTANSEKPSKATSEVGGSDGGDKNDSGSKTKDKSALTREEREARYREARQRIFGHAEVDESDSPEAVIAAEEANASRSSSASGKKKSKKRKDDDDDFQPRSAMQFPYNYAAQQQYANAMAAAAAYGAQMQAQGQSMPSSFYPSSGYYYPSGAPGMPSPSSVASPSPQLGYGSAAPRMQVATTNARNGSRQAANDAYAPYFSPQQPQQPTVGHVPMHRPSGSAAPVPMWVAGSIHS